ncbi:hypothetical protein [Kitasatospora purpeofusca]|uniref:hypothetical protein n=1 Tax=Kitasatospora purpeofusca TaxID=67352 RepID=UPI003F4AE60D
METFAEVEVVNSPDVVERADLDLPEVDIDEPTGPSETGQAFSHPPPTKCPRIIGRPF